MKRVTYILGVLMMAHLASGCAAGIAAKAVGLAVQGARGDPESNVHLKPAARQACSERAAQHGTVHVIDVEQRSVDKIVVWGTVASGEERQSFRCTFGEKIEGFRLRPIKARPG